MREDKEHRVDIAERIEAIRDHIRENSDTARVFFLSEEHEEEIARVAPANIDGVELCLAVVADPKEHPAVVMYAVDVIRKVYGRKSDEYLEAMASVGMRHDMSHDFWVQAFHDGLADWGDAWRKLANPGDFKLKR